MSKIAINIATGTLQQEEIIVGIDLGTTNSLIAVMHPESKKPVVLKEYDASSLVPSVIFIDEHENFIVGEQAKAHLITAPERTIFSVKRLMGKSYNDIKDKDNFYSYKIIDDNKESLVKIKIGDKFYSPIDLSSIILKELKKRAEHILKTPVTKAVITVPAYFNDAQRQATRDAAKLAGLDALRIINEPTAASLAYGIGLRSSEEKTIVVYDLGGGTFDVSVLRLQDGVFEVLSTHGDTFLGGDDFDKAIIMHWISKEKFTGEALIADAPFTQEIRLAAEKAKKALSTSDTFETTIAGIELEMNRSDFENEIASVVERTIASCKSAMKDAGLSVKEIDEVILVGGSTRVPAIKTAVENFFNKKPHDNIDPDEVVALGAAIQADILAGNTKDILLLDVTPLSLGVETAGGLMDVIVPRNNKIPSKAGRQYSTQVDGQSGMRITVFQGERDLVKDNRKLGEFILSNIPAMPAGMPKVEISFLIDADGILTVGAKELRSGVEQQIEIKPQYGLSDEDVEAMLLDAMSNAEEDIAARALTEANTEGEQLLKTTESFLHKNSSKLTQKEIMETAAAMQALQMALTMNDKNLVQSKIEALNDVSKPYAERVMDEAIGEAMKGREV